MAELPKITATNPVVKEATQEVTYDKYWLSNMYIHAGVPGSNVRAEASLMVYREVESTDEEGNPITVKDFDPTIKKVHVRIPDVFTEAESDPALTNVMGGILSYIKAKADADGLI